MEYRKIFSIEAVRGVAALLVVFFHAAEGLHHFFQQKAFRDFFMIGQKGVDLFFVLSGFIIFYAHHQDIGKPNRLGRYLWRRFSRIYPTYWAACAIALLFYALQGRVNGEEFNTQNILQSFFLYPNDTKSLIAVSWTLTFEIFFYTIFALLIFNQSLGKLCFGIWSCSLLAASLFDLKPIFPLNYVLNPRNLEFFFGITAAVSLLYFQKKFTLKHACFGILLFFGFAFWDQSLLAEKGNTYHLLAALIFGMSASLILVGIVSDEWKKKWSLPPFLLLLGTASYSIYLIHVPALLFFFKAIQTLSLQEKFPGEFWMILSGIFGTGVGLVFYYLVERPIRSFLTRRAQKKLLAPSTYPIATASSNGS